MLDDDCLYFLASDVFAMLLALIVVPGQEEYNHLGQVRPAEGGSDGGDNNKVVVARFMQQ